MRFNISRMRRASGVFLSRSMPYSLAFQRMFDCPASSRDQHPPVVAHRLRIDVLVGLRVLEDGGDVDAALVGEGRVADVGLRSPRPRLASSETKRETSRISRRLAEGIQSRRIFSMTFGMIETRLALPAPLAVAVDGPLDVVDPFGHRPPGYSPRRIVSLWTWMPSGFRPSRVS